MKLKVGAMIVMITILVFSALYAETISRNQISIQIKAGKNYKHVKWFGIFAMDIYPQVAVWVSDEKGNFVDTIYVSYKSAKSDWIGGVDIRRPASLPVWSHHRGIKALDGLYMPDRKNPLPDAVSGATPLQSFSLTYAFPKELKNGLYTIWVEVNSSFDYNETYKEGLPNNHTHYSGENGQPSLVFGGKLLLNGNATNILLQKVGIGEVLGKNGVLLRDLKTLTTALDIVESITVSFKP